MPPKFWSSKYYNRQTGELADNAPVRIIDEYNNYFNTNKYDIYDEYMEKFDSADNNTQRILLMGNPNKYLKYLINDDKLIETIDINNYKTFLPKLLEITGLTFDNLYAKIDAYLINIYG